MNLDYELFKMTYIMVRLKQCSGENSKCIIQLRVSLKHLCNRFTRNFLKYNLGE